MSNSIPEKQGPVITVEGEPGAWRIFADGSGTSFHHSDHGEAVEQADLLAQRYGGTLEHGDFLGPLVPHVQSDADTDPTHPANLTDESAASIWLSLVLVTVGLVLLMWGAS